MAVNFSNASPTGPTADEAPKTVRRAAVAEPLRGYGDQAGPNWKKWMGLSVAAGVIAGTVLGSVVTRQHYKQASAVAAVNGKVITDKTLFLRLQSAGGDVILRQMVLEQLQMQFAKKKGVDPTNAEVEARYQEASVKPGFEAMLTATHQSVEDYKHTLRVQLAQAAVVSQGVKINDADVHRFYQENINKANPKSQFFIPETTTVEVVVTPVQAQAQKAYQELIGGMPFDSVVAKYSTDTSKTNKGILAPIPRGRTRLASIPGLESAFFQLKVGETLGPRLISGNWWIIRCLDKAPPQIQPFKDVKSECRFGALLEKGMARNAKRIQKEFADFQRDSTIQAFWPQYRKAINAQ